jgi:hypothetical protein
MGSAGGQHGDLWGNLFKHGKKFGITARQLLLILLSFFAFGALGLGAPWWGVVVLFMLAYGYDPALEAWKARRERDQSQLELDDTCRELSSYTARKRKELKYSEPELPLELPPPRPEKGDTK